MNTKTKQLAALIALVLRKRSLVAVTTAEMLSALQDIEDTLEIISFADSNASGIKEYLYEALHTVSNLLFVLKNKLFANLSGNHRCLVTRAETVHRTITKTLKWYCNVPEHHQLNLLPVKALLKQLSAISSHLKENEAVYEVYTLLHAEIAEAQQTKTLPCHRWVWWSKYCAAVANAGSVNNTLMEGILAGLNFNTPGFINWMIVKLEQKMEVESSVEQKLEYLTTELLKYDLMYVPPDGYIPAERSVKHTMIAVLQTKLLLFKSIPGAGVTIPKLQFAKLNTALSVPQLALLIRLMIDTQVINEKNNTAILKNISAIVRTPKTIAVSSQSLWVNYYTPGPAAKNIVKEYLLNMINLLKTY